jgi:heme/copper-type cytochrome/quinol oxidase subunit 2
MIEMDKTTITIIAVVALLVIGLVFKKLIKHEEKKNDPNLPEPRDSNSAPGNQGVKNRGDHK